MDKVMRMWPTFLIATCIVSGRSILLANNFRAQGQGWKDHDIQSSQHESLDITPLKYSANDGNHSKIDRPERQIITDRGNPNP